MKKINREVKFPIWLEFVAFIMIMIWFITGIISNCEGCQVMAIAQFLIAVSIGTHLLMHIGGWANEKSNIE